MVALIGINDLSWEHKFGHILSSSLSILFCALTTAFPILISIFVYNKWPVKIDMKEGGDAENIEKEEKNGSDN